MSVTDLYRCERCPQQKPWPMIAMLEQHLRRVHYQCVCGVWTCRKDGHRPWKEGDPAHYIVDVGRGVPSVQLTSRIDISVPKPEPIETRRVPFVGYRCWRLFPQMPVLSSLVDHNGAADLWMPGREVYTATCHGNTHEAPAKNCKCGFWVLNGLWDAIGVNSPADKGRISFHNYKTADAFLVAGAVELSGRVIPGQVGNRGAVARILALWPMPNLTLSPEIDLKLRTLLVDMYDVPIVERPQDLESLVSERRAMYSLAEATADD